MMKKLNKKHILIIALAVIAILSVIFFSSEKGDSSEQKSNEEALTVDTVKKQVEIVEKDIIIDSAIANKDSI